MVARITNAGVRAYGSSEDVDGPAVWKSFSKNLRSATKATIKNISENSNRNEFATD